MAEVTGRPKYLQIAEELAGKIADGSYPIGTPLPSTSRLVAQYEVSVGVVRDAIKQLKSKGLIVGQPGKAVYVQREPPPVEPSPEYIALKQQVEGLRDTLDEAVQRLDRRVTELEQRSSRSARSAR